MEAEQSSYYREYPVAFGQRREIVGVGQSDTANNTLCRYCFQVHPFLAKKAPGTPVFGHCPKINIPLSAFAPEDLVSRDGFGSPVPHQPAHLHTETEYGACLQDYSRVPRRRPFIYLNRHAQSGQSRVYPVTQLRTDGVHCREPAGTGPVNLKVVPNECCLCRSPWTN